MKKIGLLTSGGDCQALNVTMRGVAKSLYTNLEQLEIYGFLNGYEGLIYGRYKLLSKQDFFWDFNDWRNYVGNIQTTF